MVILTEEDITGVSGEGTGRGRWFLAGGLVIAVVVAAGAVWGPGGSPTVAAGVTIPVASLPAGGATHRVVMVPSGRYELTITRPVTHVPSEVAALDSDQQTLLGQEVARGGWFVGVSWLRTGPVNLAGLTGVAAGTARATFALIAGGRQYLLPGNPTLGGASNGVYVAIPGNPAQVSVRVTFQGATQTFGTGGEHDYGTAAGYYAGATAMQPQVSHNGCDTAEIRPDTGEFEHGEGDPDVTFESAPEALPYVAGPDPPAPAGREWLIVSVTTKLDWGAVIAWPRTGAGSDLYLPRLQTTTVTVDGHAPRDQIPYWGDSTGLTEQNRSGAYYVFDLPGGSSHTVRVQQTYLAAPAARRTAGAPAQITGRLDCTAQVN